VSRPSTWKFRYVTKPLRLPVRFHRALLNLAHQWDNSDRGPYYLTGDEDTGYTLMRDNADMCAKFRNYQGPPADVVCTGASFATMSKVLLAMNALDAGPE